jgi:hypothetical protein
MYQIPATIQQGVGIKSSVMAYPVSHLVSPPTGGCMDGSSHSIASCNAWISKLPAARNTSLDIVYNCRTRDSGTGLPDQGVLVVTSSFSGVWLNKRIDASPWVSTSSILGSFLKGISAIGLFTVTTSLKPDDTFILFTDITRTNWVKWSDIGSLVFTVGKDNVAGERPLDWKGYVYAVKKLGNKVVVYGENGVSFLLPTGSIFGLNTIYRVGLQGKHAVTGDESKHFFIDNSGQLWKLSDGLKLLGYSEYLSALNSSVVMSYDNLNNLVYICDGVFGFIYDVETGSFGKGQENITGIGFKSGVTYTAASSVISTDPFEICTDIYDLGSRAGKTIYSLEFGTDLTTGLYGAIDWRRDKAGSFTQTPWYTVSSGGRVFITAYGREFRFRVKTLTYEYFELDYIKVNGVADAY